MRNVFRNLFFEASYRLGFAEWSIGCPQPDLVRAIHDGALLRGCRVLDVGCGTGDNAVFLAEQGYDVTGVDSVARAVRTAQARAVRVSDRARFVVGDAMRAPEVQGTPFDAVLDSGLLHQFRPPDAARYVAGLHDSLVSGGKALVQCFSDERPLRGPGPRQLSEAELRAAFAAGWSVDWIRPAEFLTTSGTPYSAWIALFTRIP